RTTLNIFYACVSAIVASSWATAHPNLPASYRQTFLITLYLIVFPEVVLTWALREYKDARRLSKSALFLNSITLVHAFLLLMGGFTTSSSRPIVSDKEVAIAMVRTEIQGVKLSDIKQMDKSTMVAKSVAVLQSGWLVTQAIARAANDLPLSLLELSALTFTINSLVLSILWYNKP
ncbi:hypothetical protein DFH08DRAFT_627649, partial [Mycena albidolilacea]